MEFHKSDPNETNVPKSNHTESSRKLNQADVAAHLEASKSVVEDATRSKEAAIDYLVSLGIYKKDGSLTAKYRN